MREIDMRDISAKHYVADMKAFHANTAIINTGGIITGYDTEFPFHFKNEYLNWAYVSPNGKIIDY